MKILIVGFAKIKYMPYLDLYLENIDRAKNDVHLVYWNRDLKHEDTKKLQGITLHEFCSLQNDDAPKFSKLGKFKNFRAYALSVLKEGFDFIIILHSLPGVLLLKELVRDFKNRYIFDYRDFTYENLLLYKSVIHTLVNNSYKTFVSSDAFRMYLPQSERVITSHNALWSDLNKEKVLNKTQSDKIRIAFWGFIREEKTNLEIIRKLANDERFELHFYGREQEICESLKQYASENAENVYFHGEYTPEGRDEFARNTDLIHNIYAEDNMKLAVSNKYYDSMIYRIPQLVMKGSYMGVLAENSGIGKALNPYSNDFADNIFTYYQSLNKENFKNNCRQALEKVKVQQKNVTDIVKNINK
ncbi:MAG: hypothetical protein J6D06_10095 [Clostridia bacterium]|nr:hypothetical protein [Clostridia bacterium]